MIMKKLQVNCSITLAMLLILSLFVSGIVHAEESLTQADELFKLKKYDEAKALYQTAAQNSSDSSVAIEGLTRVGRCEIQLGNNAAAEQAITALKNNHSQHPELCAKLYDLAYEYWYKGGYVNSKDLYQYITQNFSANSLAIKAQRDIARCQIRQGNYAAAVQAINTLKNNYSQHSDLCSELRSISYEYFWVFKYVNSEALWQYIAEVTSDSSLKIEARTQIILCQVKLGNNSAAEQAITALKNDYPGALKQIAICEHELGHLTAAEQAIDERLIQSPDDTECFSILNKVARSCQKNGDHGKSIELYQRVLAGDTDQNQQLWAHRGIAASSVRLGDDATVLSKVNLICQNYQNHPKAGLSVFIIGEEYYSQANEARNQGNQEQAQANFQKAIAIWDKNINQIADPTHRAMANYFTAISYKYLNDYRTSISYYQKVFSEYPESEYAAHALFMVGRNYERLSRVGSRSADMVLESGTDPNSVTTPVEVSSISVNAVQTAYKLLVEKYPDSPGAKHARRWLNKRSSK